MHSDYADFSYNFIICEIRESVAINSVFHFNKAQVGAIFLTSVMHTIPTLQKIPKFHLISWCGNFVEGDSTKNPQQEIR